MSAQLAMKKRLQMIVEHITAHLRPEKVILFGSGARRSAGADSDLDVLVVMESGNDRLERAREIYRLFRNKPKGPVDFVVLTPKEYRELKEEGNPFLQEIEREGLVIYESTR